MLQQAWRETFGWELASQGARDVRGVARYGLTALMLLFVTAGCEGPAAGTNVFTSHSSTDLSSRRIRGVTLPTVRDVAERTFRQYFHVDAEASSQDLWVSEPQEVSREEPGRLRAVIRGSDNRHRRLAGLRLVEENGVVLVQCLIRVQRLDTTERAAFARDRGDDRPTDTPIDRPGAGSTRGREEWVDVRRDRQMEREVLDAIERELSLTRPAI